MRTPSKAHRVTRTVERVLFVCAAVAMLIGGALQTFKRPEFSDLVVTVGFGLGVTAIALAALNLLLAPAED